MRTGRTLAVEGYAMVALLVGLNIMAVMATVALPVWKQMAQREKEAELIFRGEQYKRAVALFQRRNGPGTLPPDIRFLVEGRFLRRAYLDPITGKDFLVLRQGGAGPGPGGQTGGIIGVVSTSPERSIRLYGASNFYNEWQFVQAGSSNPGTPPGSPQTRTPLPTGAGTSPSR
jgi:type II secretory pathway pseudopilin PulG